jgi:predicted TPR repeat methyltransferase
MGAEFSTATDTVPATWERGRSLRLAGRAADAVRELRRGLPAEANDYRLHDELGMALAELSRQEEAIGSFLTALRLKPDSDELCNKIASAFASRGLLEPAATWFYRARQINPNSTKYLFPYGRVLASLDSFEQARQVFDAWLAAEPDNPVAQHLTNAILGTGAITKASAGYVRALFDGYAEHFDEKLGKLKYCGPQLVLRALSQITDVSASSWHLLDAGCGTGLVGMQLKSLARRLVGVDLSPRMLQIARQRSIYDELIESDILDYLRTTDESFDVIAAADVLTYIGDIRDFFTLSTRILRRGGLVVVVVETHEGLDTYRLNQTGRFSHSREYLQQTLRAAGFTVDILFEDVMRREENYPVPTLVAVGKLKTEAELDAGRTIPSSAVESDHSLGAG